MDLGESPKKNGLFTVRLTVRVYPPSHGQLLVNFFYVCLTSDYDYL